MENEIWRPIAGYEGLYEVSDNGGVKSLHYNNTNNEQILTPIEIKNHYRVNLKGKYHWVHRLVAMAFPEICGDYFDGAIINHKNENGLDNRAYNLEWCTYSYNRTYGSYSEKIRNKLTNRKDHSKSICQYKDGVLIGTWPSAMEIERTLGYRNSHILECCKGKLKTAYGFVWRYAV